MAPLLGERRCGSVSHRQASPVVNLGRCLTLVNSPVSHPRLGQCTLRRWKAKSDDDTRCTRIPSTHDEALLLAQWRAGQRHLDSKSLSLATPDVQELGHVYTRKLKYSETHLSPRAWP